MLDSDFCAGYYKGDLLAENCMLENINGDKQCDSRCDKDKCASKRFAGHYMVSNLMQNIAVQTTARDMETALKRANAMAERYLVGR